MLNENSFTPHYTSNTPTRTHMDASKRIRTRINIIKTLKKTKKRAQNMKINNNSFGGNKHIFEHLAAVSFLYSTFYY